MCTEAHARVLANPCAAATPQSHIWKRWMRSGGNVGALSLWKEAACGSYFSQEAVQWSCEPVTSASPCLQPSREPRSSSGCSLGLAALFQLWHQISLSHRSTLKIEWTCRDSHLALLVLFSILLTFPILFCLEASNPQCFLLSHSLPGQQMPHLF